MNFILFIIVYPIVWVLSILPMRLLYIISDFLFLIVYYIVGYRKKVVYDNLKLAFPNKEDSELKRLTKKSIHHFTDFIVESIKSHTVTKRQIKKRYVFKNPEVIDDIVSKGKSIALVGCHQNNWEWSVSLPLWTKAKIFGAYTKLNNSYFNTAVKRARTKFGLVAYKTKDTIPEMIKNMKNKDMGAYILLSDQSPQLPKAYYWRDFFGIHVPVHTGAELLAKKFDMAIVNFAVMKSKRGYYEATFDVLTDSPKEFDDYQLTDKYFDITEKHIKNQPGNYLWTHKRFKHKDSYDEWLAIKSKKTKK